MCYIFHIGHNRYNWQACKASSAPLVGLLRASTLSTSSVSWCSLIPAGGLMVWPRLEMNMDPVIRHYPYSGGISLLQSTNNNKVLWFDLHQQWGTAALPLKTWPDLSSGCWFKDLLTLMLPLKLKLGLHFTTSAKHKQCVLLRIPEECMLWHLKRRKWVN